MIPSSRFCTLFVLMCLVVGSAAAVQNTVGDQAESVEREEVRQLEASAKQKVQAALTQASRAAAAEQSRALARLRASNRFVPAPGRVARKPTLETVESLPGDLGSGKPGDPILFRGSDFGSDTEVWFKVRNGVEVKGEVIERGDTLILATIPTYSGVQNTVRGEVTVRNNPLASDPKPFSFEPHIVRRMLETSMLRGGLARCTIARPRATSHYIYEGHDGMMVVSHTLLHGEETGLVDELWRNVRLKNGWCRREVVLTSRQGTAPMRIEHNADPQDCCVRILWDSRPAGSLSYVVGVGIEGPEGLDYLDLR